MLLLLDQLDDLLCILIKLRTILAISATCSLLVVLRAHLVLVQELDVTRVQVNSMRINSVSSSWL